MKGDTIYIEVIAYDLLMYIKEKKVQFNKAWTTKNVIRKPQNKRQRIIKKTIKRAVKKQIKNWR